MQRPLPGDRLGKTSQAFSCVLCLQQFFCGEDFFRGEMNGFDKSSLYIMYRLIMANVG